MDPALASTPPAWALLDTACARLLTYPDKPPPAGFRLEPEVADGFPSVSRDGKTYTFRLRPGFRFSDRTPVRANSFARAINRVLAPEMNSPGVQYVRDIVGQNPFYGGSRPHHVAGFDVDLRAASPQEVLQRVDRGEADWGHTLAGIYFDPALALVEKYGINRSQLHLRRGLTLRMLAFNSSRPLFRNNPSLRRAVNFALNRRTLVSTGGVLVSRPTDQYLPSILPGFKDADVYPLERPNLERAKSLANGNLRGGRAILYVNSSPLPMAIGQLVRQQLAEIELEVDVRGIPIHSASAAHFKKLATPGEPWDIAFGLWSPSYIDPYAYINLLFDRRFVGGTNFTRFVSGPYDKQMRRAARLPQGSDRNSAYAALDVRLARDPAPLAAVDFLNEPTLVSKRVGCIVLRPVLDLTAVCLKS